VVAAGLVAYPAAVGDRVVSVVAAVGIGAWAMLALALVGKWPTLVAWGMAGVGAEYALFLRLRGDSVDERAPLVAAGLIAAAELAYRAVDPEEGRIEPRLWLRAAIAVGGAAAAGAVIGGLLLVAAGSANAGLALEAAGILAAVAAVALVVRIAVRR
jgi:hypothetical protein